MKKINDGQKASVLEIINDSNKEGKLCGLVFVAATKEKILKT